MSSCSADGLWALPSPAVSCALSWARATRPRSGTRGVSPKLQRSSSATVRHKCERRIVMSDLSDSTAVANPVAALRQYGQSVWLDFIRRSLIAGGELKRLVDEDGLGGVTSTPAIFEKAIDGSDDYAAAIQEISDRHPGGAKAVYERLAIKDIQDAADVLRSVYDRTGSHDGYVSLEVSPDLANDTN